MTPPPPPTTTAATTTTTRKQKKQIHTQERHVNNIKNINCTKTKETDIKTRVT